MGSSFKGLKGLHGTRNGHSRTGDPGKNVYSPDIDLVLDEMSRLRETCRDNHIDFICEFTPGLDVFDPARFQQGIFRFGLPAVSQMARVFEAPPQRKFWRSFSDVLRRHFEALDDEYLGLVKEFWDNGQLFENTTIDSDVVDGQRVYFQTDRLQLARNPVLAWD
jgi:hypothetical protein